MTQREKIKDCWVAAGFRITLRRIRLNLLYSPYTKHQSVPIAQYYFSYTLSDSLTFEAVVFQVKLRQIGQIKMGEDAIV